MEIGKKEMGKCYMHKENKSSLCYWYEKSDYFMKLSLIVSLHKRY